MPLQPHVEWGPFHTQFRFPHGVKKEFIVNGQSLTIQYDLDATPNPSDPFPHLIDDMADIVAACKARFGAGQLTPVQGTTQEFTYG